MSGATLRFVGEHFNPQDLPQAEEAEIYEVPHWRPDGQPTVRRIYAVHSPFRGREKESFSKTIEFFCSMEKQCQGAGLLPRVEIGDLLMSVMVHPRTGARFKVPARFFRTLQNVASSLSIHFVNDSPGEPVWEDSNYDFLDNYDVVIDRGNFLPDEADSKLGEFLQRKKKAMLQKLSMATILPGLSARSRQTARFNLKNGIIEALACRGIEISLDVIGAAAGRLIARKHRKAAKV